MVLCGFKACIPWKMWQILEGTDLENIASIKYLGVTITNDLRWNTHVSNVCTKANRTLRFLRQNLHSCPEEVKEAAYKGLVCPVLKYGCPVADLEILYEVNLNFQVWLTIILACGIFPLGNGPGKFSVEI